jgi:hypothetical protein
MSFGSGQGVCVGQTSFGYSVKRFTDWSDRTALRADSSSKG